MVQCYLFQLQLSLVFFLVFADMAHSQLHYYITPSSKIHCPGDPCLTLAELATNSSNYLGSVANNKTTVSLSFLPGNHNLDGELSLSQAANFSMTKGIEDNGTVFIECESQSGRFVIHETTFVAVKKLNFVGCGNNSVIQVVELVIEDTTFQSVKGRGTGLVLKNVITAHITRSLFIHNIRVIVYPRQFEDYFFGKLLPINTDGRALKIEFSSVTVTSCNFTNNTIATDIANSSASSVSGGALYTGFSNVSIVNSTFTHNTARVGGVLLADRSHLHIVGTSFCHNRARHGGVMIVKEVTMNIDRNHFGNNTAEVYGGVILTDRNSFMNISGSTFDSNTAKSIGGVILTRGSLYNITNSNFINNRVTSEVGAFFFASCSIYIANSTFGNNSGSLYIFNSNLTLSGCSTFVNCTEPSNTTHNVDNMYSNNLLSREGGAITSIYSNVIFTGESKFSNNQARYGGAMLATESKIMMYGGVTVVNNSAVMSGGGIFLQQSDIEIKEHITISNNHALMGGGMHVSNSVISVYQQGTLHFSRNKADNSGGGLYLEINSKIYMYIQTSGGQQAENDDSLALILFYANHARLGGAMHVADNTNSGACSPDNDKLNECFFQTFPRYPSDDGDVILYYTPNTVSILFSDNIASEQGANLFGGLLDRCSPTSWPFVRNQTQHSGVSYLSDISNIALTALDTISSLPVRICFCKNTEPDCSYEPAATKVTKGQSFNVSLVAVNQANHSVDANIRGFLSSPGSTLKKGHQQSVRRNCTNVTFNVFSPHDSEELSLYADGPCGQSTLSVRHLNITFTDCTCPVGFEPLDTEERCECICDSRLRPAHITNCDIATSSLVRVNTSAWIDYISYTNPPGYIIHPHCPFDYCKPLTKNISINLNDSDGADEQCAYNRTGILCGGCQKHLSLSLGSSRCVPCQTHWPVVFIVILIAAIVAGIVLVTALLALNITVAVGLINGFIFYANIVAANSAVFFPSTENSFPTVFIAWLNLDIGIDVCFIDGLDTYIKTWFQLFFPTYIISLVVIIIIVSEYSPRFAGLIGKKDPIATLATLILLSYAKLLSVSIIILLPADLDYPDGSKATIWLPDGNINYRQQKHLALWIVAGIILIIVAPYTILLFLWQWLVRAPTWKIFKWMRNTKLNAFISVHHAPYNSKYRYWAGLQLLVRVILFAIGAPTKSKDPQASLLAIIILVGGLLTLKTARVTVYKNLLVDVIDTGLNFNLLALSAFSFYHLQTHNTKQIAVLYTSTVITLVLLVGAIIYHIFLLVKKDKCPKKEEGEDGVPLAPVQPTNVEITHSVIEIAQPCDDSPPPH